MVGCYTEPWQARAIGTTETERTGEPTAEAWAREHSAGLSASPCGILDRAGDAGLDLDRRYDQHWTPICTVAGLCRAAPGRARALPRAAPCRQRATLAIRRIGRARS